MKVFLILSLTLVSFVSHANCRKKVKDIILSKYQVSEENFNFVEFKPVYISMPEGIERYFESVTYSFDSELKVLIVTFTDKNSCEIESVAQIVQNDQ